jgi:uncharacterized membrane protein YkoI
MNKTMLMSLVGAGILTAGAAHAKWVPELPGMMDACSQRVTAAYPGTISEVETAWENGRLIYEFELARDQGPRMEVECAAMTGEIVEAEYEDVPASWSAYKSNSNLSDRQARHIALQAMPGKIVESEREYELNGGVAYEFEIVQADGVRGEIEIDARTGLVRERGYEIEHSRYW